MLSRGFKARGGVQSPVTSTARASLPPPRSSSARARAMTSAADARRAALPRPSSSPPAWSKCALSRLSSQPDARSSRRATTQVRLNGESLGRANSSIDSSCSRSRRHAMPLPSRFWPSAGPDGPAARHASGSHAATATPHAGPRSACRCAACVGDGSCSPSTSARRPAIDEATSARRCGQS
eukprot:scaffold21979_cov66-Phaeocystis_antarctica.AAC.5